MFTVWASLKTSFNTQQHINVTKRSIYDAYMIYSVKNKSNSSYRRALWVAACWGGPWKPLKPKLWGFITLRAFHPRGQTTCFSGLQESQLSESATLACWFGFVQKIWRGQKGPVNGIWLPMATKSQPETKLRLESSSHGVFYFRIWKPNLGFCKFRICKFRICKFRICKTEKKTLAVQDTFFLRLQRLSLRRACMQVSYKCQGTLGRRIFEI